MPQVASAPVISPPVRSDAPARAPGQGESSGAFGEMLEASSAAPDAGDGKPASAKSKESSLPAAQEDAGCGFGSDRQRLHPPVVAIDLALLAPELPVEGSAAVPVAVTETDDGEPTASGDAHAEDTKTQASGDAASVSTDPKAAEIALTVVLAPPPAPAALPVQAHADCCRNLFKRADALCRRALQERTGRSSGSGPGGQSAVAHC